jgi:hypothetical protein
MWTDVVAGSDFHDKDATYEKKWENSETISNMAN